MNTFTQTEYEELVDAYGELIRVSQHLTLPAPLKGMMERPLDRISNILHAAGSRQVRRLTQKGN